MWPDMVHMYPYIIFLQVEMIAKLFLYEKVDKSELFYSKIKIIF